MTNKPIKSIEDLLGCARKHPPGFWLFRGHSSTGDEPQPTAYRAGTFKRRGKKPSCGNEPWICQAFRDKAHGVYSQCPADNQYFEWLALMRHHLAPTRLLDWSRNILVAAFFAVESGHQDSKGRDREIWALDASALTKFARDQHEGVAKAKGLGFNCGCLAHQKTTDGKQAIIWSVDRAAQTLAKQAFIDERKHARREHECTDKHCCIYPQAVAPPRAFPRLVSQSSWFTIHPRPSKHSFSLRQINEEQTARKKKKLLEHFVIPKGADKRILDDLAAVGVTHATLIPDLEGLAQSLIPDYERLRVQLSKFGFRTYAAL